MSKVSHGNHHNPQADEYAEAERCSDQQTCVHCAFPFIRARLKSQARVRGNAIYITSAACVQKDRDESASLYFGPFGASLLGLAGSLLLSRSASACCAFLNASYSGVPGLGGTPLGIPPSHSGAYSPTVPPEILEHETRNVLAMISAIRRGMEKSVPKKVARNRPPQLLH